MKLIEKVVGVLKTAGKPLTVNEVVEIMIIAGDPFTKDPKHTKYVKLGHNGTAKNSMSADVHTVRGESGERYGIVTDKTTRPLTMRLK